jgi:hypothetical protein
MRQIQEYSLYLVVGFLFVGISYLLDSDYLSYFLKENLVILLVALLAINTTTSSVVMTKLKEIAEKDALANFNSTIAALRLSIYEQIAYVGLAVFFSILAESTIVVNAWSYAPLVILTLLSSIFIAALAALFDTAKSIFVILNFESME